MPFTLVWSYDIHTDKWECKRGHYPEIPKLRKAKTVPKIVCAK
jgi:hypothetical protein